MTRQNTRPALRRLRKDSGQGMTEYIVIVALIAIAAIGIVTVFGNNIRTLFGGATAAMAGETAVNINPNQGAGQATKTVNLRTFGTNNTAN